MGMTLLGVQDIAAAHTGHASNDAGDAQQQPLLGGFLQQSRILYPLEVGEWSAAAEHLYDDQQYGVSIRYAHGQDLDRWIDLYFYPAGRLSTSEFSEMAHAEADGIRLAHRQAGNTAVDMGALHGFSPNAGAVNAIEGVAMDMGFTCDDIVYSSAMTLTLDRLYFVKARYSIEEARLSRRDTLQQLQAFVTALQPRLTLRSVVDAAMTTIGQSDVDASDATPLDGLREIRLDYRDDADGVQSPQPGGVRIMVA
jgi:hypothetical protein